MVTLETFVCKGVTILYQTAVNRMPGELNHCSLVSSPEM